MLVAKNHEKNIAIGKPKLLEAKQDVWNHINKSNN